MAILSIKIDKFLMSLDKPFVYVHVSWA